MLRFTAIFIGMLFIASGVMGFIPEFVQEGRLFGLFPISSFRNILHLATGSLAFLSGIKGARASRVFFIAVGVAYLLLAIMGFYHDSADLFQYIASTATDNWLNTIIAAIFLYIGLTFFKHR